ncbi:MAG TPA: nitronate monooxygenase [Quisquiliibacterium sp.]|nr:nitronate monooxygenase [Quisquiliibacterium sp.]HPA88485.1 nitronate monooxygenase [Quisquiliibacterium sp.]HQD83066.1 nitronate monooxygenase [Quisquiliibacterium sp.]HQN10574.1 nitronate monooxygenase [Quisquiliibacterium sp.]HQP65780.1 nitronate monooxygenase [Quisquiliibacterium sp.]
MPLPDAIASRLRLPLIAAPMLRISGVDLTAAACIEGVIGSFPTVNAREPEQLDLWMTEIAERCARAERPTAPVCPNVLMRTDPAKLDADVEVLVKHKVEMVLASVGSPEKYVRKLHDVGCFVLADVGSMRHAERALESGVDGLVLLSAGAGGQTGWANGMSFVRAVRKMYDGPLVLAGGISDGHALLSAQVLGCDLGLMGTRFIATQEAMADPRYKAMLIDSGIDDIQLTRGISGIDANFLRPSIIACGLDPEIVSQPVSKEKSRELFSAYAGQMRGPKRWVDLWSAGHTVSAVERVCSVAELVDEIAQEYDAACAVGRKVVGA